MDPYCRNLNLFSFLIKPVQRLCKYPLLLKAILEHSNEDHPDYQNLIKAKQEIEVVVDYVNKKKKDAENLQTLLEIQNSFAPGHEVSLVDPSRRLLYADVVRVAPIHNIKDVKEK